MQPFLEETPHAAPPATSASNDWVNFAVNEAAMLQLSNRDKALAQSVLTTCETETQEAFTEAAQRARPWYRRIF